MKAEIDWFGWDGQIVTIRHEVLADFWPESWIRIGRLIIQPASPDGPGLHVTSPNGEATTIQVVIVGPSPNGPAYQSTSCAEARQYCELARLEEAGWKLGEDYDEWPPERPKSDDSS